MDILKIQGLQKRFGTKEVLKDVNLSVCEHSIFGFIGTNGAGKTTTMKTILGLIQADAGTIEVAGEKVCYGQNKTNQYIGYLPDVPEFYDFMTPREYLNFCGKITGMSTSLIQKRTEELLNLVGLQNERKRIKGFSRGMKQRLGIAQALFNKPKLLICDEPTSALDPVGRKEILDILLNARKETTILFSTHILSDVERICTNIVFLKDGKIFPLDAVKNKNQEHTFRLELKKEVDIAKVMDAFVEMKRKDDSALVFSERQLHSVLTFLLENSIPFNKLERMEPTLESLFMEVAQS